MDANVTSIFAQLGVGRLIPEFIVIGTAILVLVLDFFMAKGGDRRGLGFLAILGSIIAGLALIMQSYGPAMVGMLIQDSVAIFFKAIFVITSIFVLFMATLYEERIRAWKGEYYSLIMFAVSGMMLLSSVVDLISLFVSLEFMAITLYILAAYTKDESPTVEGGLKYLITGALSSGFLLYGITFIYGATGTTAFSEIAASVNGKGGIDGFLAIGIFLMVIGLTFKIGSIPFHVWAPDVYEGAPTPTTAFLAAGSKAAGFILLLRFLFTALGGVKGGWIPFITAISAATLIFGNLAAMPQKNIKRMIAYAGIGSAGYLLMGIAAASSFGAGSIMFYLLSYIFAIAGTFIVIVIFSMSDGSDSIEAYKGLSRRSPLLAATLFIGLLSLAGVPPLSGFIAKLYIFAAVMKEGIVWLASLGVLMAIISMYYFLLVMKRVYLHDPVVTEPIKVPAPAAATLYLINAVTIILGVYPGPVTDWVMRIAEVFI
ncbi:MAG: NADH-quinone oxidoreductase subunit N [Thermodesulfobacteriota bacterium]